MTPQQKMEELQAKVKELLEDPLYVEIFNARCHDSGETTNIENAKLFKEDLLKRNVKNSTTLNLQSLRLGINAMIALSNSIQTRKTVEKLNLADNSITDYGMNSIKNILQNCGTKLTSLNLASNMISGQGIELFLDDLMQNRSLKHLDLGVLESSMRKNSLGIQGAVCLAALLVRNKTLESLSLNDNDFGSDGGEAIGVALAQNHTLKALRIAENDLKSEGALQIIANAHHLEVLSLAKNQLKADCGVELQHLLTKSKTIKKLQLEFNELMTAGAKCIAQGLAKNKSLELLNVKGNVIGDQGIIMISQALRETRHTLRELDISLNEIGPQGFQSLCGILPSTKIQVLICNKNFLGDDILSQFASIIP